MSVKEPLKICSWNINSIRLRQDLLLQLINQEQPDIIALQETKCPDEFFPYDVLKGQGYQYIAINGEKSYNGVAIISKLMIENSFSLNLYNDHKRHIAAKIAGIEIHNFYVPAGGDEPDLDTNPKYVHKLEYISLIQQWFLQNRKDHEKMVLLGDFNIAPHEHDVWSSKQLRNVVSHTLLERQALQGLQESFNFIDTGRSFTPLSEKLYSWWSYRNKDWQKSNRGRRLDHIWITPNMEGELQGYKHLLEARNWSRPSDHIPIMVVISK